MDGFRAEALESLCAMFPKVDRRILRAALMEAKAASSVEAVIDEVIDFVAEMAGSSSSSEADANDIPDSQDFQDSEQSFATGNVVVYEPAVESFIFSGNSAPPLEPAEASAYPIITEVTDDDNSAFLDAKPNVTSEPAGATHGTTATVVNESDSKNAGSSLQSSPAEPTLSTEGAIVDHVAVAIPLSSSGNTSASEEPQISDSIASDKEECKPAAPADAPAAGTSLDAVSAATSKASLDPTLDAVNVNNNEKENDQGTTLPVPADVASNQPEETGSVDGADSKRLEGPCESDAALSAKPAAAPAPTDESADLAGATPPAHITAAETQSVDLPVAETAPADTPAADTTSAQSAGADLASADAGSGDISTSSSAANSVYERWSSSFASVDVADISATLSDLQSAEQQLVADVASLSKLLSTATSAEQHADEAEAGLPFAGAATLEEARRISADVAAFRDVLERRAADVWGETTMLGEEAGGMRRRLGQVKGRLASLSSRLVEIRSDLAARLARAEDRLRAAETSHRAAERAAEEAKAAAEADMQQALADEWSIAEKERAGGQLARELEGQKEAVDVLEVQLGEVEVQIEALLGESVFGLVGGEEAAAAQEGSVHEGAVLVPNALSCTAKDSAQQPSRTAASNEGLPLGGRGGAEVAGSEGAGGESNGDNDGAPPVEGSGGAASELFASASEETPDSSVTAAATAAAAAATDAAAPSPAANAAPVAAAAPRSAGPASAAGAAPEEAVEDAAFAENMRRLSEELREEEEGQGGGGSAVTAYRQQQQQQGAFFQQQQDMPLGADNISETAPQQPFVFPEAYHAKRPIRMIPIEGSGNHGGFIEVVDEDGWGVVIQADGAEGMGLRASP